MLYVHGTNIRNNVLNCVASLSVTSSITFLLARPKTAFDNIKSAHLLEDLWKDRLCAACSDFGEIRVICIGYIQMSHAGVYTWAEHRQISWSLYRVMLQTINRLPGWAGTRKVKPIWILLKQETVSCSGISWAICKSAPHCRQITMPSPHQSVFYRPDAVPAAQPTASKHWRYPIMLAAGN